MKVGLAKTIEYFRNELKQSGEIIPTGPNAARPKSSRKTFSTVYEE